MEAKPFSKSVSKKRRANFVERTLATLVRKADRALFAEDLARADGFLQKLDPRVKIVGLFALILSVVAARNFSTIIFVFALAIVLAVASKIPLSALAKRAWLGAFFFTGAIALPVIFITPGTILARLPVLDFPMTEQGIYAALYLIFRVETTVTLSLLLILSTLWTGVLKALRVLRVPTVFVVILGMTYRYIFVMLETARNMFEARQSRLVGAFDAKTNRRIAAASIGVLLSKSFYLNAEVYLAMQSRGFRGEIYTLDDFAMQRRDWFWLAMFLTIAVFAFWLGRQDSARAILDIFIRG